MTNDWLVEALEKQARELARIKRLLKRRETRAEGIKLAMKQAALESGVFTVTPSGFDAWGRLERGKPETVTFTGANWRALAERAVESLEGAWVRRVANEKRKNPGLTIRAAADLAKVSASKVYRHPLLGPMFKKSPDTEEGEPDSHLAPKGRKKKYRLRGDE